MKKINKTQEEILDAAKYIYQKVGYRGSTFQMLVDRSGISRSLINYYFPKKQDVLVTLLGNHLDRITDYVSDNCEGDSIMTYMLSLVIYNYSTQKNEQTLAFHTDVLFRTDRKTSPYKNYDVLYQEIIKEYNIDITEEDFYLKEIAIFGAMSELMSNYMKNNLTIDFKKLNEQIIINTLSLLKIPFFVINSKLDKLWEEYDKINSRGIEFNLFG